MNTNIAELRKEYTAHSLEMEDVDADPIRQFERWFQEALNAELPEPNAMVLSTADRSGMPSARVVLLKGIEEGHFLFYTNYQSRKGQELEQNPRAALTFLWHDLQRQVRIAGSVERLSPEVSTDYFQSRPKGSQIGAWASPQSQVIDSRAVLQANVEELEAAYAQAEQLPRPEHWGGYRIKPSYVEFWQGRSNRLHDRIVYLRPGEDEWKRERLAP